MSWPIVLIVTAVTAAAVKTAGLYNRLVGRPQRISLMFRCRAAGQTLRQSVYSRSAGYEDVNNAERVSADPTFRLIGSEKIWDRGVELTSRLQSFGTELLAEGENLAGLGAINRELIAKAEALEAT